MVIESVAMQFDKEAIKVMMGSVKSDTACLAQEAKMGYVDGMTALLRKRGSREEAVEAAHSARESFPKVAVAALDAAVKEVKQNLSNKIEQEIVEQMNR